MKIAYHIWTPIEQSPIDYVNTEFTSTVGSRDWSLRIAKEGITI
jgi:hypothetical protein